MIMEGGMWVMEIEEDKLGTTQLIHLVVEGLRGIQGRLWQQAIQ